MAIQRMDHVGVIVEDLAAVTDFFVGLGLEVVGEAEVEGDEVDRIIGLTGAHSEIRMLQAPNGGGRLEVTKFLAPSAHEQDGRDAPANTLGLRHLAFEVEDIDSLLAGLQTGGTELVGELVRYGNSYRLCYVRGPEGIIVELAERVR